MMRALHVLGAAALAAVLALPAAAGCRKDSVELRGPWGSARFRVELAETPEERSRGLMFREEMPAGAGMLFVYPEPQREVAFWMRNTLIPLDMLFFDETGRLTALHINATPRDESLVDGGSGVKYVLEINGGLARDLGVTLGTEMRNPEIGQDEAAWAC